MADDSSNEKRRSRRQNRRQNQKSCAVAGSVDSSTELSFSSPPLASKIGFSSLPAINFDGNGDSLGKSGNSTGKSLRKYFPAHWDSREIEEAIARGHAFKAKFRVNAHNRLEAYCSVDGLSIDILINGVAAQNRAIEGDTVAIMLEPVAYWTKLKGSNLNNVSPDSGGSDRLAESRQAVCSGNYKNEETGCNNGSNVCSNELERAYPNHVGNGFKDSDVRNGFHDSHEKSNGNYSSFQEIPTTSRKHEQGEVARSLERICTMINSNPSKRPTGKVISIVKASPRREAVVGFLSLKQLSPEGDNNGRYSIRNISTKSKELINLSDEDSVQLTPTEPKFPCMVVAIGSLPECARGRLKRGDVTVERELVAARIDEWCEENLYPRAVVVHVLGQGGEIEPQIAAIIFENIISSAEFSLESLACLPSTPWNIPDEEINSRKDLRGTCIFTIDPPLATDLDDALSIERISENLLRVGVHIADASYFVHPGTSLDAEAQVRSTSVYILRHRIPMLPPKLSEEVCSLVPGVDRLAFSIIWDIDQAGNITGRWIGHSVVNSCCKLSYEYVQYIVDREFDVNEVGHSGNSVPQLHGQFKLSDIVESLRKLHEVSKKLREIRFRDGALSLDSPQLGFLFDDDGMPYDSFRGERKDSCTLVEEFMLLANKSVAEVISRAFPDCALLRRHPKPNLRKLREFEAFCLKHGFELETSASGKLHLSLSRIKERLKDDPSLFDILVSYASKPMQLATYFCTGDLRGSENSWSHYSLSCPVYTHFTSPLRRYPDIVVHRTLSAVVEAEKAYHKQKQLPVFTDKGNGLERSISNGCFTGLCFDMDTAESKEGRELLSSAAVKFQIPGTKVLAEFAEYCNDKKLAGRKAEEDSQKLYLWALLKKKEVLVSDAKVLGLGPKFMSIYIEDFALERRIYYDDVDGLTVEWLENTCTLVLDMRRNKPSQKRGSLEKSDAIEDVALIMSASEISTTEETNEAIIMTEEAVKAERKLIDPVCFPLVLRPLSNVPVALNAVGGHNGPLDIAARLYMFTYFK